MKIALAQINATVGDLSGNSAKICDFAERARAQAASLMLTPELALCGYPPEDLLLRQDFYRDCERALQQLASRLPDIAVIVGHPHCMNGRHYNAASLLQKGRIAATYHKHALPNHAVFDEQRYFDAGRQACVFSLGGMKLGINICEDAWPPAGAVGPTGTEENENTDAHTDARVTDPPRLARDAGAQALLVLNASPYHVRKQEVRQKAMRRCAIENAMPLLYVNLVGGQDELVFDGASFVLNRGGEITQELPSCREALAIVTFSEGEPQSAEIAPRRAVESEIYEVLSLGLRDYVSKNGFSRVLLGLSGGIDSALTLAIAADTLGAKNVHALMMPSRYTAAISIEDARAQAAALDVIYSEIPITPMFESFLTALAPEFKGLPPDVAEENLQSRIRGNLLMALSNKFGQLVLTTGNKSEMATGYATLYGDMAGGFGLLKDVSKAWVYRLATYRNERSPVIPQRVIERAPSAELRSNQTDQDSLPPYDELDAIMEAYVERNLDVYQISHIGARSEHIERVLQLLRTSEYKRKQAPPGIRITSRGFGKDWRWPITNKYRSG